MVVTKIQDLSWIQLSWKLYLLARTKKSVIRIICKTLKSRICTKSFHMLRKINYVTSYLSGLFRVSIATKWSMWTFDLYPLKKFVILDPALLKIQHQLDNTLILNDLHFSFKRGKRSDNVSDVWPSKDPIFSLSNYILGIGMLTLLTVAF